MRLSLTNGVRSAVILLALVGVATPASADWLLTPYFGITFGKDADFGDVGTFSDNLEKKLVVGGSLGWMGAGVFGFEIDLGVAPNFFETTTGPANFDFGDSNVTSLMANAVLGAPIGGTTGAGFRPYGSGGIGLLRTHVSARGVFKDLSTNELGLNVGGGAHVFFNDHVGLRGDVRYFRKLQKEDSPDNDPLDLDLGDFDFWRGTIGVTFRFGG